MIQQTRKTRNGSKVHTNYTGKRSGHWITPSRRLAIYLRDNFCCAYCGKDLRGGDKLDLTLDHLKARVTGGTDSETNLVTACRPCNSQRGDKKWTSYATGGAIIRINALRRRKLNISLAIAIIKGDAKNDALESLRRF